MEKTMKILAVDDDPIIHDLLKDALAVQGYDDLTCAGSSEEALDMIESARRPFDTFLLDILLPGIDGVELCRRIRERSEYRATPVIMITASRQPNLMQTAFAAGATDYVTKPFDALELGTRVNLASMLSDSLHREALSRHTMEELTKLTRIGFEDRVTLNNVYGVSDFLAIENGLLRSTSGCYALSMFAIQIQDVRNLFNTLTPPQFRKHLEQVSAAIVDSVNLSTAQIAYAGRGMFVYVQHGRQRIDIKGLCREIEAKMSGAWDAGPAGMDRAPDLKGQEVSGNRLWSGMAASNALNAFLAKQEKLPKAKPSDEETLFATMAARMRR
jgi:CheY-like chemotaxis protein